MSYYLMRSLVFTHHHVQRLKLALIKRVVAVFVWHFVESNLHCLHSVETCAREFSGGIGAMTQKPLNFFG